MNTLIAACFIIAANCFLSVAVMYQTRTDNNNRVFVQALCDWSHTHNDGSLEQRCGEAQDKTHSEYLCVTRSSDMNCWTEVK